MVESSIATRPGEGSPRGNNNHDLSTSGQNTYTARPQTFSRDSTEFEWWKSKMYIHIIGLDDEL